MENKVTLSVVIPVYNSERTVAEVSERLIELYGSRHRLKIILVNDGSTDQSAKVCLLLSQKHPEITFINLSRNFGQHNATLAGMHYADGDFTVTMDDDLQHPPQEVGKLLKKIQEGHDIVYGQYEHKRHSTIRNVGSRLNNIMAWAMIGKPTTYDFTSFRIMRRHVTQEITKYDAPFPYIDGLILRTSSDIGLVAVRHENRAHGGSNYTIRKLIGLWFNGFFNFSLLPLRLSIWCGFIMATFGFLFSLIQVMHKLLNPTAVLGWTSLITSIMLFSGVQLAATGIIGEYIGRIFLTQNKTPSFVVKSINSHGHH
jgi:undecaprenyl-phosphate 4-deoxy-4-formamido-L-arabinose transferase